MKKLFLLLSLVLISGVPANGQLQPVVKATPQIITPPYGAYGYTKPSLAGQDMVAYATPYAEVDRVTSWSVSKDVITFKTTNNTLQPGDVLKGRYFYAPGNFFNKPSVSYVVATATPTSVTINVPNQPGPLSGAEESAVVEKYAGPSFSGSGKWEIKLTTPCGGTGQPACETFRLYTQDGSQDTGFLARPVTTTGTVSHINFQVGPTPGACTTSGRIQDRNFAQHSTIEYDVKFTLDADPTQTSTQHYLVCANGGGSGRPGVVHVVPGYRQIYHDRYVPLQSWVFGNTDKAVDWSIVDAPSQWNGRLVTDTIHDTNHPQVAFYSGTAGSGQVHVKACMHSSPRDCGEVTLMVSANAPPAANADKVEQVPCENDPDANFTNVFDIGPTQTHHSLLDFPQSWNGSLLLRIHNEGAAGSPTAYHQYMQISQPSSGGPYTDRHPAIYLCGVPNPTTGELPILDAHNAVGNTWNNPYMVAPYAMIGIAGQKDSVTFTGANKVISYVTGANLLIRNLSPGHSFRDTAGAIQQWEAGYGIRPYGLQYFSLIGIRALNDSNPFFDQCQSDVHGWAACTQDTFYEGNVAEGYGIAGRYTEHPFYLQGLRVTTVLNNMRGRTAGAFGTTCYSSRASADIRMYNRCSVQAPYDGDYPGGHSEMQDDSGLVNPDEYWGYQGASSCAVASGTAIGCAGQLGGEDWFAAMAEEHNNTDINVGNADYMSLGGAKYIGLSTTHTTIDTANSVRGFYAYNTFLIKRAELTKGAQFGEILRQNTDIDSASLALYDVPVNWMRMYLQNNIIPWKNNNDPGASTQFGLTMPTLFDFRSNLVAPGQVTITANMHPVFDWRFPTGFYSNWNGTDPWNPDPLNQQWAHGMTQRDFISYNKYPVDLPSMRPLVGSNAIGTATPLRGVLAGYPPLFNAVDDDMSPFTLRSDLTVMGAYDTSTQLFRPLAKHP